MFIISYLMMFGWPYGAQVGDDAGGVGPNQGSAQHHLHPVAHSTIGRTIQISISFSLSFFRSFFQPTSAVGVLEAPSSLSALAARTRYLFIYLF
jgi:hypothetical protein